MLQHRATLTDAPAPAGNYAVARLIQGLVFVAGMTPKEGGALLAVGHVGDEISPEDGRRLAGIAAKRALAAATTAAEKAETAICGVASLTVFVAVTNDFRNISEVADGASAVLEDLFGRDGLPARTAVGVTNLPGGAPVEIQLVGITDSKE